MLFVHNPHSQLLRVLMIDGPSFSHNDLRYIIYNLATMSLRLDYRLYDPHSAIDLHHILLLQPIMILHHYCALPLYERLFRHYLKLLKNYQKMVGMSGFEPPLYRFSYYYNFRYSFLICSLDFLFIITFLF